MTIDKNDDTHRDPTTKADLGRTPERSDDRTRAPDEVGASMYQLGFEPVAGGRRVPPRSPLVHSSDYASTERDARIYTRVRAALQRSPVIDAESIELRANDGVVELRGEVASEDDRELVRMIVSGIVGVRGVRDRGLEIRAG